MSCEHHFLMFALSTSGGGAEMPLRIPTKNGTTVRYPSTQVSTLEPSYGIISGFGLTTPHSPILESRKDSGTLRGPIEPSNLAGPI
jgi:pyruvate/2-oxoglutarate/acetoin dehydrogenase E1 component